MGYLEFNGSGRSSPDLGGYGWPWVAVVMKSGKKNWGRSDGVNRW